MNLLTTASIGLYVDAQGLYFMQIIVAATENHYFTNISEKDAREISKYNNIEIERVDYTISSYNHIII